MAGRKNKLTDSLLIVEACWYTSFATYLKSLKEDERSTNHLPLPSLDVVRIKVSTLKVGDPSLRRSCRVTIWGTQDDLHVQVIDAGSSLEALMVRSSVHKYNYLVAPAPAELLGKNLGEP